MDEKTVRAQQLVISLHKRENKQNKQIRVVCTVFPGDNLAIKYALFLPINRL